MSSTARRVEAPAAVHKSSARSRLAEALKHPAVVWSAPGLIYLFVRQVGLYVLQLVVEYQNKLHGTTNTALGELKTWDGEWFLGIAAGGYNDVPGRLTDAAGRRSAETPLAFFPGYPALVRWVDSLPGVTVEGAAFAVSLISGLFCAYGLFVLGRAVRGGSVPSGLILVTLFAASPMAVVLSMTYSEATFCAFAVWALVGVVKKRWILAGVSCAAAGLVRPTAGALIAAVVLAAVVAVIADKRDWRAWVGALAAPLGLLGYLAWVAIRTRDLAGWFGVQQRGWGSKFDGGSATWKFALEHLGNPRSELETGTVWLLVLAIVLVFYAFQRRLEWPLIVYAIGVIVMDIGSNGLMNSKARLLLPAFTLLVPLALVLARRRLSTVLTVLGLAVLFSAWFGAYSLAVWQYAI
ncbi:membrane protein [Lentzea aerocolonigenes]|uniref:membrane protein n=1 Tax=Lentzea aerocolonigenes TaxID=68170 RepID=UPI0005EC9EE7|nr:membrane protein [Lentzea aerocolonigenes]